jgi:hypothetical protein
MRIVSEDRQEYLELTVAEFDPPGDLIRVAISLMTRRLAVHDRSVWFSRHAIASLSDSLRSFGFELGARVQAQSVSPDEATIEFVRTTGRGHTVAVISMRGHTQLADLRMPFTAADGFEVDPTRLEEFATAFALLCEAG